jgi:2-polyprenyl-3-methyl-5-hydroxy-6-metoxy-1,4-benzoquinol methylase
VPEGQFWVIDVAREALNKKCDLVICSEVLEHIVDDTAAIRNLRQMTGKYLLISTPQGKMREFEKEVGHVRNYARGELVRKLEETGFVVVSVIEWGSLSIPLYIGIFSNLLQVGERPANLGVCEN